MQIAVGHLFEPGGAGLNRAGDRPAYFDRHWECSEHNKNDYQNSQHNASIQRGFELPLTGLNGDAPFLVAANGSESHKFVVAIKIICPETGFPLEHT
ncbi:MAG: hypothetical protein OSJ28_11400, partial [Desulfovibrio sp.]|nr:hypothetical protein [Desulfovibrio sp.]